MTPDPLAPFRPLLNPDPATVESFKAEAERLDWEDICLGIEKAGRVVREGLSEGGDE